MKLLIGLNKIGWCSFYNIDELILNKEEGKKLLIEIPSRIHSLPKWNWPKKLKFYPYQTLEDLNLGNSLLDIAMERILLEKDPLASVMFLIII